MIKNIVLLWVLLTVTTFSYADNIEKENLVRKIIETSGMEKMIESFPEQIEAQHIQRRPISKEPEIEEAVTRILLESFIISDSKEVLFNSVKRNINDEQLVKIIEWLDSPLGKRFTLAETNASHPNSRADLMRYAADLQTNPPAQDRIILIQNFEKSSRQTDSAIKVLELIMYGMMSSLKEFSPQDKNLTEEAINKQIADMKPMLQQLLWQQMLLMSHFMYQEFNNLEIEKYIKFLDSDAGKKYIDVAIKGYADVFNSFFISAMPKIKQAAEIRKASENKT